MTPLAKKPLRRSALAAGSPRHFWAVCSNDCGWRGGQRTADSAEDIPLGRKCPKCGSTVKAVTS